jgi:L-cysteine S-thiosulfotransferase
MNRFLLLLAAATAALVTGCASPPSASDLDAQALAMIRASFRSEGIASVDRLVQDAVQQACSSDHPPPAAIAEQVQAQALATIRWPADGRYIGDWREGEKLAQSGRGMTWSDSSDKPSANGAQCYNCHQINQAEISYGTIGPSLWNYGKLRGVKSVTDPASAAVIGYTWAKLWNAKAYAACSTMPRFGHMGLLDENQLRHVMALLLDPASPVNR